MKYQLYTASRMNYPWFFITTSNRIVKIIDSDELSYSGARTLEKLVNIAKNSISINTRVQSQFDKFYIQRRELLFEFDDISDLQNIKETNPELFI